MGASFGGAAPHLWPRLERKRPASAAARKMARLRPGPSPMLQLALVLPLSTISSRTRRADVISAVAVRDEGCPHACSQRVRKGCAIETQPAGSAGT